MSNHDLVGLAADALSEESDPRQREAAFKEIGELGLDSFFAEARVRGGAAAALSVVIATGVALTQQSKATAEQFGIDEEPLVHMGQRIDSLLAVGRGLDAGRLTFSWLSLAFAAYSTVAEKSSGETEREALSIAQRLAQELEILVAYFGEEVAEGDPQLLLEP